MIRLISDSSTLYSIEEGKALPCDITPLCVTINGKTYREFEEINAETFLGLIKAGYIPSSSQPSMGELVELFEKYPDDEILVISMADGLSGTYQTAEAAAMGGLLKLQPIMIQAEEGRRLEKFGVGRSFDAAVKSVLGKLEEHVQNARVQISVSHAFSKDQADKILAKVKDRFPNAECVMYDLSCAFITQGGPRCIAIQSIEL